MSAGILNYKRLVNIDLVDFAWVYEHKNKKFDRHLTLSKNFSEATFGWGGTRAAAILLVLMS